MYTLLTTNLHLLVWHSTTPSCGSEGDWLKWKSQETFCSWGNVWFLLHFVIDKHPWTFFFFPVASLYNQCMPWILIWDENSLRKREMESLPAHIHYMCSGASGKYLRLPGMSWKKLCLHYFLILVPKHRELKVSILGQPWRNLLFWKVRWHYVLQKFLWISFMCFSQCLHSLINTSDYLPAWWCLPFSSVV